MTPQTTPKSEATRARILAAALRVFRERGFPESTMREIAAAAGVAVGAAYYYFDSKDALVMAFYEDSQTQIIPALDRILAQSRTLEQRLRGIIEHKFDVLRAPIGRSWRALSAHIDPSHPALALRTPHTAPSAIATSASSLAIHDSGVHLPPSILPYLPRLLWLYQMGLMLYWVYDRSPRQAHTHCSSTRHSA